MKLFSKKQENKADTEVVVDKYPPCDFCNQHEPSIIYQAAHYDGNTDFGWAYMCDEHFKIYGKGLGLGKGQKLLLKRSLSS